MPDRPMRVLYVMHTAAPDGSSASLQHLIASLPVEDVEPIVVSRDGPVADALRRSGVAVLPIGGVAMLHSIRGMPLRGRRSIELGRTLLNLRHGRALGAVIERVRPDIVHLNERGMLQAAVIARRSGAAVVMHARSVADPHPVWVARLSRRIIRRNVDRVIAIDGSVARSIRTMADVEVVHNPVVGGGAHSVIPAGSSPPTDDGRVRVVYLASLAPAKGIWDFVAAAERLRDHPGVRFTIAGTNGRSPAFHASLSGRLAQLSGLIPDVETALRRHVARTGLGDSVELVGHVEDPAALLRASDILVFPSHHDGPGRSVLEAAVEGVPAVVALEHRVEDVVVDGVTGLIVPPRDPAALAGAIARLADHASLRTALGMAARIALTPQSDPVFVADRIVSIYRDVLARRAAAAAAIRATGQGRGTSR
jgi:glycosyltransferase involved in cell wall biosynthesis